jgi:hypothetical protein
MHETREKMVKGYIDNSKVSETSVYYSGWCFHEEKGSCEKQIIYHLVDDTTIFDNETTVFDIGKKILREDVSKVYERDDIIDCGWEFSFEKRKEDKIKGIELQMLFDEKWNTIFILETERKVKIGRNFIPSYIVVDNFYEDPYAIRRLALTQNYEFHPDYHKGKRTEQVFRLDGLKENFESILNHKIINWEKYPVNACFQYCIGGDQLVYHVDIQQYAGIIFLTPDAPPQAGTSFFRSKYTKKNKVAKQGDDIVFKNGYLDPTEFELVDVVGNVFNRLVLFDAHMIHAASTYFGNRLENGRLFQLFFFDLE